MLGGTGASISGSRAAASTPDAPRPAGPRPAGVGNAAFRLWACTTTAAAIDFGDGSARIGMTVPHLRHFIFTVRPSTLSSEIWYLAEQLGQENFIRKGHRVEGLVVSVRPGLTHHIPRGDGRNILRLGLEFEQE